MSSLAPVYLVAVLAFLSAAVAMRHEPYDFCSFRCVKRIYRDYCGGATCVDGVQSEAQRVGLCSPTCIDALSGDLMTNCLQRKDPARRDFDGVIQTTVQTVESFCGLFKRPLDAEAPAPEEFFPPIEAETPAPDGLTTTLPPQSEAPVTNGLSTIAPETDVVDFDDFFTDPPEAQSPAPNGLLPTPVDVHAPSPHVDVEEIYDIDDLVEFD